MITVEVTCKGRTKVGEIEGILTAKKQVRKFVEDCKTDLAIRKGDPYHIALLNNGVVIDEKDVVTE